MTAAVCAPHSGAAGFPDRDQFELVLTPFSPPGDLSCVDNGRGRIEVAFCVVSRIEKLGCRTLDSRPTTVQVVGFCHTASGTAESPDLACGQQPKLCPSPTSKPASGTWA